MCGHPSALAPGYLVAPMPGHLVAPTCGYLAALVPGHLVAPMPGHLVAPMRRYPSVRHPKICGRLFCRRHERKAEEKISSTFYL